MTAALERLGGYLSRGDRGRVDRAHPDVARGSDRGQRGHANAATASNGDARIQTTGDG
jgi:hypothetical protein